MDDPNVYILVAPLSANEAEGPWELASTDTPDERRTLWPGPCPRRLEGPVAGLGEPVGDGLHDGELVWLEARPAGRLLGTLGTLPDSTRARIAAEVAGAIAHLHRRGMVHGQVGPDTILLSSRTGHSVLLGGWRAGEERAPDLDAVRALLEPSAGTDLEDLDADGLHTALSERASEVGAVPAIDLVDLSPLPIPSEAPRWTIHQGEHTGRIDEVVHAIGADEHEPGLLEPWSDPTGTGGQTGDRTGSIESGQLGRAGLTALLSELATGAGLLELQPSLMELEPMPANRVKALIADEPVDLLPSPAPRLEGPARWDGLPEHPVEITAIQQSPFNSTRTANTDNTATGGEITQVAGEATMIGEPTATLGVPTTRGVMLMAIGVLVGLVLAVSMLLLLPMLTS